MKNPMKKKIVLLALPALIGISMAGCEDQTNTDKSTATNAASGQLPATPPPATPTNNLNPPASTNQ
jgi:hypothetical protein